MKLLLDKQTHETIRHGTNFEQVKDNVLRFIKLRNNHGSTKVLVRFIRQESNVSQWEDFRKYWKSELNEHFGDDVLVFDVHNFGGDLDGYEQKEVNRELNVEKLVCQDVFERMIVTSTGNVLLCCADDDGYYDLGNVLETNPIDIYNNDIFRKYREAMQAGNILELPHCGTCTIPRSRFKKQFHQS